MVLGIKKSSSLPILFDNKELNNNFDTNKSMNNTNSSNNNENKKDSCKHNSLMRKNDNSNNNNNTLRINSKLFLNNNNNEFKEKKIFTNNNKLKVSESGLDSFRFSTTPCKTNIINHSSTLSINDKLQQISLTDSLKKKINNVLNEPVRVIKITEIIEIKDSDSNNNNNNNRSKQIEMSPHSTTSTTDSNESNDDSDTNNNNNNNNNIKNTQHESNLNKTFFKSPPINRKTESRSKPHQIHSTTHVKTSDYFNFNQETEKQKKRNETINDNILMEIFKLTNKSLNKLEKNNNNTRNQQQQQQQLQVNTFNSLKRQTNIQEFKSNQNDKNNNNDDGIPVVHNFSFVDKNANLPQNDPNNRPKRILIKITGRTRSSSNDPNNLMNKVNLNLGKYQLDQVYSQTNQIDNSNNINYKTPIQLKIHRLENKIETNNHEEKKFSVDKFKSYLNNIKESDISYNRSLSSPPVERNVLNEKLMDNQIAKLRSTPNRSSPARKIEQMPNGNWMETFKPEPDFSNELGTIKPFQSNHHLSLIKNAGDIIYNKTSAFNSVKINNNDQNSESIWTFRENNPKNAEKIEDVKSNKDKQNNNLGSFSCGLISPRPKNLRIVLHENLIQNDEYDYSPTFYQSENYLANDIHASNINKIVNNNTLDKNGSSINSKFVKKVSSYYNDYYRDLFLNRLNKNSEHIKNDLEKPKQNASKYIDEDEDTSSDTNIESYSENHLDESMAFPMNNNTNNSNKNNNYTTKRSNLTTNQESIDNNEITPRTPKLSRRVIFADECYK